MTQWLKQSTAVTLKLGPFVDETDGKTAETALTISQADVRLSKNGGDMAQKNESTSCTHDEIGVYDCPVDATDTGTLGRLQVNVHESGALPVWHEFMVVPAEVWDNLFAVLTGAYVRLGIVDSGTAQSATATTLVLRSAAAFANDTLIGTTVMAFGSTQGYWQSRVITDNTLSDDTVVVDTWTVTPSGTITYVIVGSAPSSTGLPVPVNVTQWLGVAAATPTTGGVPEVDLTHILGAAVSTTTAQLGVNVERINNAAVVGDGTSGDKWRA